MSEAEIARSNYGADLVAKIKMNGVSRNRASDSHRKATITRLNANNDKQPSDDFSIEKMNDGITRGFDLGIINRAELAIQVILLIVSDIVSLHCIDSPVPDD